MWLRSFQTGKGSAPKLELAPVLRCLCLCCGAVIGIGKTCHYAGLQFPHGSRWEEECNTCQCVNGKVECTKVSVWKKKQVFFLFYINKLMCSWHFFRWCVAGGRACCQGRQGERFTPVQEVVNAWSTTSWRASLPLATSGGFVQGLKPPQPSKPNVSPTQSIWTRAVLASPLYSTRRNYPQ